MVVEDCPASVDVAAVRPYGGMGESDWHLDLIIGRGFPADVVLSERNSNELG